MLRQMPPQLDRMSICRICELVDRLVTDRDRMALQPHPTGDLLRRPAVHDPLNDGLADMREAGKLPQLGTTLTRHVMRRRAMIAAEIRPFLVDIVVARTSRKIVER